MIADQAGEAFAVTPVRLMSVDHALELTVPGHSVRISEPMAVIGYRSRNSAIRAVYR